MLELDDVIFFSPSMDDHVFGPIDNGSVMGAAILFEGGLMRDVITNEMFKGEPIIGRVVGMKDSEVLMEVETGYIGWIVESRYRVLNLVIPDTKSLH